MSLDNKEFEAFLREFDPRQPRPLPPRLLITRRRAMLAAAAGVLLAASVSAWLAMRKSPSGSPQGEKSPLNSRANQNHSSNPISIVSLTRLAQEDPRKLDFTLDKASRDILPAFQGKGSTLSVLAKE